MVDTYSGNESRVYVTLESTYGVMPENASMWGVSAENFEPSFDSSLKKVMGIGSRDPQALKNGLWKLDLKLTHILPPSNPFALIGNAFSLASFSTEMIWYKGVFDSASDILDLVYNGCRINKLSVECKNEDFIKATIEIMAQTVGIGAQKTGTTYTDYNDATSFFKATVQRGDASGANLVDLDRVTDWKFDVDNNLKAVVTIPPAGSTILLLKSLQAKNRVLSGELTFEFETLAEFLDVFSAAEFSLKFNLSETTTGLYIIFTGCKWDKPSIPTKVDDLVSCKATFTATGIQVSD